MFLLRGQKSLNPGVENETEIICGQSQCFIISHMKSEESHSFKLRNTV